MVVSRRVERPEQVQHSLLVPSIDVGELVEIFSSNVQHEFAPKLHALPKQVVVLPARDALIGSVALGRPDGRSFAQAHRQPVRVVQVGTVAVPLDGQCVGKPAQPQQVVFGLQEELAFPQFLLPQNRPLRL